MNAEETAELLARECADGMHTVQHDAEVLNLNLAHPEMKKLVASMILKIIPLVELLNVADAAHNVNENLNEFGALTDGEISNRLHDAITALRAKLLKV